MYYLLKLCYVSCREKVLDNEADILPTYNSLYKTFSRGAAYLNDLYMLVTFTIV